MSVADLDNELNQMILAGNGFPDAFDRFYADEVVMHEANGVICEGKEANRKREQQALAGMEFHKSELVHSATSGDVTFSEWRFDATMGGHRATLEQVARRVWKDGKVVHERFYYNYAMPG